MKRKRNPYRYVLFVCTGKHCAGEKSKKLRDELNKLIEDRGLDEEIRCSRMGCLGTCEVGPIVIVSPGDRWFSNVKPKDAEKLLDTVLKGAAEE